MAPVFSNNATSTLAVAINTSVTVVTVGAGDAAKFPVPSGGTWFPVTLIDSGGNMEIMKCTGRSGANLTVVRAQEGTTAQSFAVGSRVDLRMTAAALTEIVTTLLAKLDASAYTALDVLAKLVTVDGPSSGLDADTVDGHHAAYLLDLANATGSLPSSGLPGRLGEACLVITDWNSATTSGFYQASGSAANTPAVATHWGIVIARATDQVRQFVWQNAGVSSADLILWGRTCIAGTWSNWFRMRWSQDELDVRYMVRVEVTAANPNLNAMTTAGSYYLTATPTNGPAGVVVSAWSMLVFGGGNVRTQILSSYDVGRAFMRGGYESAGVWNWEPWRELLTTSNLNGIKGQRTSTANVTAAGTDTNKAWMPYSAAHTITIPLAASHTAGTVLGPYKNLDPILVTLQRSGSDVLRLHTGTGSPSSVVLAQGQECYLVSDGAAAWDVFQLRAEALIAKADFSAVSQIALTLPPGFRRHRFNVRCEFSAGSSALLLAQLSTDGGATWISSAGAYSGDWNDKANATSLNIGQAASDTSLGLVTFLSGSLPIGYAEVELYSARDGGTRTMLRSHVTGPDTNAPNAPSGSLFFGGWRGANEDNNAIRIYPSTGTISGWYTMEGIL